MLIYLNQIQKQSTCKMECFCYGFNFPNIQKKAASISRKFMGQPRLRIRIRPRYRYRHHHKYPIKIEEPPKIPLKIYRPPTFSIELHNMFEILDI
jgi:hypothetical protein